jgi:hypothetical protein
MKTLFLFIFVICIFSACQRQLASFETSDAQKVSEKNQVMLSSVSKLDMRELQKIQREIGYTDFVLNKDKKTWQELDKFYQSLPDKCKNPNYLIALQESAIKLILKDYKLIESNEGDALIKIDFYADNLFKSKQIDAEIAYLCLIKLKNRWSINKFNNYHRKAIQSSEKAEEQFSRLTQSLKNASVPEHLKEELNKRQNNNSIYLAKLKSI